MITPIRGRNIFPNLCTVRVLIKLVLIKLVPIKLVPIKLVPIKLVPIKLVPHKVSTTYLRSKMSTSIEVVKCHPIKQIRTKSVSHQKAI